MKRKLSLAVLSAIVLIGASCKKTETVYTPASPETAPVNSAFFVSAGTTITASGSGNYEYGVKFAVSKNGKITKLACKMPIAGTYRVTLWDASGSGTALGEASIVQSANGTLTYSSITPVAVTTGKDYLVSLWSSGQWYEIRPIGGGNFAYPFNQGSIIMKGYQWTGSAQTPRTFPNSSSTTYVAGLADFEFQAD